MNDPEELDEEILTSLTRADELLESGLDLDYVCLELGVSRETYRVWRLAHSRTFLATARRARELERAQAALLGLIAAQSAALVRLQAQH